jgi:predicted amidohydrolase
MPRKIRVTTISMPPQQNTIAGNWERALQLVDAAGAHHPDLICLPESMLHVGTGRGDWPAGLQRVDGPFVEQLASRARRYSAYIAGSLYVEEGDCYPNKTLVIDREGNLAGSYDKVHPTYREIDSGVTPGPSAQVVETDFGRLGLAICFDIGWPEHWAALAAQGAELVVWPSAYDGGFPLQVYAWTHFYYVVSSVWGDHSKIIDITGQVLASTSHWSRLVTEEIDLEKEVFHIDDQVEKLLRVQATLGDRVHAQGFSQENIFTLESNDSDWPLARIKREFGLENFRDYHARSTRIQDAARSRAGDRRNGNG